VPPEEISELTAGEKAGGMERRLCPRFPCAGFAEVIAIEIGFLFRGEIRDISRTGCYISTCLRLNLQPFSEVDVLFRLNKHEYRLLARVILVRQGKGVGLEFIFNDPKVEKRFETLLMTIGGEEP
jgi:hypothetical protein